MCGELEGWIDGGCDKEMDEWKGVCEDEGMDGGMGVLNGCGGCMWLKGDLVVKFSTCQTAHLAQHSHKL